ncbi:transcriptional regulator with GAF, ATPase, and Fis domain [Mycolicibacterium sp. BK634]|uniref:ANTAR domain-containing response regulator n=1 Tax=Mycolicibacterium sp. BK634 TaxID=2587099 RepID=UPI00160CA8C4|nr:GAF and ANTAR domain-containing protein [Mycolicibacterium sp. BK634]MBB3753925.1 transcriptional regulator with GAF, ATPase, and Fis domain [Mycolicibacterium sp. BK634]
MDDTSDPRVEDSIPTDVLDGTETEQAAEIVVDAAIRKTISPAALGRMLVDAGRSIADENDLLTLLQQVAAIAHEAIEGADYTGITIDLGGLTYTAVHTDERTLRIDSDQYEVGDGPCLHAARTRSIVLLDSGDAMQRWPAFAAAARTEGVHSFLAAPLYTDDLTLGSFNLYGRAFHAFDSLDAEILDLLTTAVSRAIGDFARFKSAEDTAESIQRVLQTRAPIEQAKGVLMAMRGIDADEAFDVLRVQSQATNVPVRVLAVDFLDKVTGSAGEQN